MILFCCASELGLPEDLSAIGVILYYYYYYTDLKTLSVKCCIWSPFSASKQGTKCVRTTGKPYDIERVIQEAIRLPMEVVFAMLPMRALGLSMTSLRWFVS